LDGSCVKSAITRIVSKRGYLFWIKQKHGLGKTILFTQKEKKEEKWNIPILPKDSYLSGVELKFLLAT